MKLSYLIMKNNQDYQQSKQKSHYVISEYVINQINVNKYLNFNKTPKNNTHF